MKMDVWRLLIIILIQSVDFSNATAADRQWRLGVEDNWPPYADERGLGVSRNIVEAALAAVQQPVTFTVLPYARVLRSIDSGLLDGGFNITRQQSTEKLFVFGEQPILLAPAALYFAPSSTLSYKLFTEIPTGTRVAVIIGYEYGDEYERQRSRFDEYPVNTHQQLVKMLLSDRVDIAVMFEKVADFTLRQMQLPQSGLRKSATVHNSEIYVGFNRHDPQAISFAAQLDKGIQILKAQGRYEALLQTP